MAVKKVPYAYGEGTEVPAAGNVYNSPSPRESKISQTPYTAPSSGAVASNANSGTECPTFSGAVIDKITEV
jgi:hypothetical protein